MSPMGSKTAKDQICPACKKDFPTSNNIPRSIKEHMEKKHRSEYQAMKAEDPDRFNWTFTPEVKKRPRNQILDNLESGPELLGDAQLDSFDHPTDSSHRRSRRQKRQSYEQKEVADESDLSDCPMTPLQDPAEIAITKSQQTRKPDKQVFRPTSIKLKAPRRHKNSELSTSRPWYYSEIPPDMKKTWLQDTSCQAHKKQFKEWSNSTTLECAACTSRSWNSGGCRFQHIRMFMDPKYDSHGSRYVLVNQVTTSRPPKVYKPLLTCEDGPQVANFVLNCISSSLKTILAVEQEHEKNEHILRRPRETDVRPVCDGCSTTIFSGHWVCFLCAREMCLECYNEWDDGEDNIGKFGHMNRCKLGVNNGGERIQILHTRKQMIPYTRFQKGELLELMTSAGQRSMPQATIPADDLATYAPELSLPYAKEEVDAVDLVRFQKHWATGKPLLLTGCLSRFLLRWDPDYFIQHYGEEDTQLVDVIRREVYNDKIGAFFTGLKDSSATAARPLKLNDWPNVADFATAMPDLFNDFEQALPVPLYTRRKGQLNLAAWFPPEYLPPDLGPKLYCAGASSDQPGAHGTTVLHMDMTDAVNIMTWAGPKPEDRPGCAVWDIFPLKDADTLRTYLLEKIKISQPRALMDDPIRRAQFYLTTDDLLKLQDKHNVVPWRVYQNPGDAVFIPAGCAHQVCNLTSCIKVACDFVSPENVNRCSSITTADRRLAALAKREDVLQLKNLIYFAFLGVSEYLDPQSVTSEEESLTMIEGLPESNQRGVHKRSRSLSSKEIDLDLDTEELSDKRQNSARRKTPNLDLKEASPSGHKTKTGTKSRRSVRSPDTTSVVTSEEALRAQYSDIMAKFGYDKVAELFYADPRTISAKVKDVADKENNRSSLLNDTESINPAPLAVRSDSSSQGHSTVHEPQTAGVDTDADELAVVWHPNREKVQPTVGEPVRA